METLGFRGGSDGKESACNAGDIRLITGHADPLEKGMGPLFLSWLRITFLVTERTNQHHFRVTSGEGINNAKCIRRLLHSLQNSFIHIASFDVHNMGVTKVLQ